MAVSGHFLHHGAMAMKIRGSRPARWLLALFALPFCGVGVFVGGLILHSVRQARAMQEWPTTPARLLEVGLEEHGDDSTTWMVTARYTYAYEGQTYEATRVGLHSGSDNIGEWHRRTYRQLQRQKDAGATVPAHVNPARPGDAILFPQVRPEMLWFEGIFVVCFGLVGFGLLAGALFGYRGGRRIEARAKDRPGEPWLWREDWANGAIRTGNRLRAGFIVLFAVLWNAMSWGIAILAVPKVLKEGGPALLVLLFPAIGVGLAAWAVREVLVARRYGSAVFQMASVPGVLGGRLAGVVKLPDDARRVEMVRVRLQCVESVRQGKSTSEAVRWEDASDFAPERLPMAGEGAAIPVLFAPPFDQPPSDPPGGGARITWRLTVQGRQPGVDVDLVFDVPVFATGESRADFQLDRSPLKPFLVADQDPARMQREGVLVEALGGQHVYEFPAGQRKGQAMVVTLSAAVFCAAGVFLWTSDAPRFMAVIFSGFALLLVWSTVDAWFGSARVEADARGLRWSSRRPAGGRSGELAAGEVADIVSERWGETNGRGIYRLRVVATDGRRITIGRSLYDKPAADALATDLKRALGRTAG